MAATTMTQTAARATQPAARKRLLGIKPTPQLTEIFNSVVQTNNNKTVSPRIDVTSLSRTSPLSKNEARAVLHQEASNHNINKELISIIALRALEVLVSDDISQQQTLERALQGTSLAFSNNNSNNNKEDSTTLSKEQIQFHQRLERLKLRQEESKYTKLTNNINKQQQQARDDDITTKSMTYAASIGLNMIVAPLSFGCFMYFFGGGLLDFVAPKADEYYTNPGAVDVRKVIMGVVSGVAMLFIEMLLFVIRTHEMDEAMTKKKRKKKDFLPFGEYSSQSLKTYVSGEGNNDPQSSNKPKDARRKKNE